MKKIIVITGTPCSGKTTISERLSRSIGNSTLIKANDLVKRMKLFKGVSKDGEMIADMKALRSEIEKQVRKSDAELIIIEGHLLCDMRIRSATAIVVREHLKTLLKRMRKRGYSNKKIEGNIVSEAIDYCGVNAAENYMQVYEIAGGESAVREISQIIKGRKTRSREIDMLGELNGLAKALGKEVI